MQTINISFQIMTRAEPVALVKQTIDSLLAIKANNDEILIVDNNHSDETLYKPLQDYCRSLDDTHKVRFFHEDYIVGYKAGALNYALSVMDPTCDYIVVVDSDYQALSWARKSIVRAVNQYPHHALLQFPQYYRDFDKTDIHTELNHYFSYRLMSTNNQTRSLSTGTFAVIKKQALIRMGGWSGESITEDAQMGVLMHLKGEQTQFIPEVIATGVLPNTLIDLLGQRRRWIYGNMQVLLNYPSMLGRSLRAPKLTHERSDGLLQPTRLPSFRYIQAHLSQLSAWVNLTGVFIIIHAFCLMLLVAIGTMEISPLLTPVLTIIGVCYLSYAVFMGRRLLAYMLDDTPLLIPYGTRLTASTKISANTSPRIQMDRQHRQAQQARCRNGITETVHSNTTVDRSIEPQESGNVTTSVTVRFRAWLVHLSFWELGALSWLPVLWGQKKPFICTPKFEVLNADDTQYIQSFIMLPKLIIILNILTIILVLHYSYLLSFAAVTVLSIKLLSSWIIIKNFDSAKQRKFAHVNKAVNDEMLNIESPYITPNSAKAMNTTNVLVSKASHLKVSSSKPPHSKVSQSLNSRTDLKDYDLAQRNDNHTINSQITKLRRDKKII